MNIGFHIRKSVHLTLLQKDYAKLCTLYTVQIISNLTFSREHAKNTRERTEYTHGRSTNGSQTFARARAHASAYNAIL